MTDPILRSRTLGVLAVLTAGLLATDSVEAQSRSKLKSQLREREKAAGEDVEKLFEAAEWGRRYGLDKEADKILDDVLDLDPDHLRTRELRGYVKIADEWILREDAREARAERRIDELKDAGLKNVDGIYVEEERVDDAKNGRFWQGDERITREEKLAFQSGMVRHPETGVLIDDFDLVKAENGLFPTPEGWVDEERANALARGSKFIWRLRTYNAWILGTKPLDELQKLSSIVDSAIEAAASAMHCERSPDPEHRPTIWFVKDSDGYNELTGQISDGGSAYGACLSNPDATLTIDGTVVGRVAVVNADENWTKYWARHAGGLAYAAGLASSVGVEFPRWFLRAVAGKVERHSNRGEAKFFGDQHLAKGGINDLRGWFSGFSISPDLETRMVDYNVYQAGLVLDYALQGSNADARAAVEAIGKAIDAEPSKTQGRDVLAAIEALRTAIVADEAGLKAYFQKVLSGN